MIKNDRVKAFVATTAVVFGLIVLAHIARVAVEGVHLLKEPVFVITSIAAVGICAWAVVLLGRMKASGS